MEINQKTWGDGRYEARTGVFLGELMENHQYADDECHSAVVARIVSGVAGVKSAIASHDGP